LPDSHAPKDKSLVTAARFAKQLRTGSPVMLREILPVRIDHSERPSDEVVDYQ
jgi:hypothetical protein